MGAHRVAADIAFVQFLQYYGLSMHDPDAEEVDEHDPNHHHDYAGGPYPKLLEFGQRIARLDPYFNPAILDVAGALAFNQKRTAEALVLLEEAAVLDPSFYRYRLYMAAILYRDKGRDDKVAEVLAEAIQYPDCPLVLKNILANLYVKYGRFADAARVRLHIIETAPVEGDREFSRRKLAQILAKHPEIAAQLR
jgi:tetratricopeptide (TPR) repeat protein